MSLVVDLSQMLKIKCVCKFVENTGSDDPRILELLSSHQRILIDEWPLNVSKRGDERVDRDRLLGRDYQVDVGLFLVRRKYLS